MAEDALTVLILDDPDKIALLADFTRMEILHLLSTHSMTETQLSEQLGLTKAAVGYHLHLLIEAGLIYVEKTEVEKHGIVQKYYKPTAKLFIIDPEKIPNSIRRHFIWQQMERLIGALSILQLNNYNLKISPEILEKLAVAVLEQLREVGMKYVNFETSESVLSLEIKIYGEALTQILKQKEWRDLFLPLK